MLKYFEDLKKGMGTDDRPYTGATILGNALGETVRLQSKKHLSGLHLDPAIKSAALNSRQNRESV